MLKISTFLIILISVFATKKVRAQKIELDTDSKKLDHTKYQYFDINDYKKKTVLKLSSKTNPYFLDGITLALEQKVNRFISVQGQISSGDINSLGLSSRFYYKKLSKDAINNVTGPYVGVSWNYYSQPTYLGDLDFNFYSIDFGFQTRKGRYGLFDLKTSLEYEPALNQFGIRLSPAISLSGFIRSRNQPLPSRKQAILNNQNLVLALYNPNLRFSDRAEELYFSLDINFSLEKKIAQHFSLLSTFTYSTYKSMLVDLDYSSVMNSGKLSIAVRAYPFIVKRLLKGYNYEMTGFYLSPNLSTSLFKQRQSRIIGDEIEKRRPVESIIGGIQLGFQDRINNRLFYDFYAGMNYSHAGFVDAAYSDKFFHSYGLKFGYILNK